MYCSTRLPTSFVHGIFSNTNKTSYCRLRESPSRMRINFPVVYMPLFLSAFSLPTPCFLSLFSSLLSVYPFHLPSEWGIKRRWNLSPLPPSLPPPSLHLLGSLLSLPHSLSVQTNGTSCAPPENTLQSKRKKQLYYPVDISTTVFSYTHTISVILHGCYIARAMGLHGILTTTMCFN